MVQPGRHALLLTVGPLAWFEVSGAHLTYAAMNRGGYLTTHGLALI